MTLCQWSLYTSQPAKSAVLHWWQWLVSVIMPDLLASAYPTCMNYYLTTQVFTSGLNWEWCAYHYNSCICTYIHTYTHTYCFQVLLCWSFRPTTLNYLQVSPSSLCWFLSLSGMEFRLSGTPLKPAKKQKKTTPPSKSKQWVTHTKFTPLCTTTPPSSQVLTSPYMYVRSHVKHTYVQTHTYSMGRLEL